MSLVPKPRDRIDRVKGRPVAEKAALATIARILEATDRPPVTRLADIRRVLIAVGIVADVTTRQKRTPPDVA